MTAKFGDRTMEAMGLSRLNGAQPAGTQSAQQQAQISGSVQAAPRKFSASISGDIGDDLAAGISIPIALAIGAIVYMYIRWGDA